MPKAKLKTKKNKKTAVRLIKSGQLKFDKTLMAVTAVVAIAMSGYLFYQGSQAATLPSKYYAKPFVTITNALATDGKTGNVICPQFRISVYPGNPGSICVQSKAMFGTTYFREGYYNYTTALFTPEWPIPNSSYPNIPPWFIDGNYQNDISGGSLGTCSDGRPFVVLVAVANTHIPYYSSTITIASFGAILHYDSTLGRWTARAGTMAYKTNICSGFYGSVAASIIN